MKRSKFTNSQIMDALKRVEAGLAFKEICKELAISTPTLHKWREDVGLLTRMNELEAENARLKKMYADERLKSNILQEALRKN